MKDIILISKETKKEYLVKVPDLDIISQIYPYQFNDRYSFSRINLFICQENINVLDAISDKKEFICSESAKEIIKSRIKSVCDFFKNIYYDYKFLSDNPRIFEECVPEISNIVRIYKSHFDDEIFNKRNELFNYAYFKMKADSLYGTKTYNESLSILNNRFDDMPQDYIDISLLMPDLQDIALDILRDMFKNKNKSDNQRHIKNFDDIYKKNIIWFNTEYLPYNLMDILGVYMPVSVKIIAINNLQ